MKTVDLTNPIFTNEDAARAHFEAIRWPNGPYCPYCGSINGVKPLGGKSMGPGWYHCGDCRRKFTAAVGTIYERSHIPMTKWLLATHLMCASKKGMSAHQLGRMLGLTYKSAWFMCHRIREGMRELRPEGSAPLGGANKVVEVDETYVGGKEGNKHAWKRQPGMYGGKGKEAVVALVERGGKMRSHRVANVDSNNLAPILKEQIDAATYVMSDDSPIYPSITGGFAGHGTVNHSIEEYVRGGWWHINTAENYFSIFKRGIVGVYHHVSPVHLKRYLGEFDFRYNERQALDVSDRDRARKAVAGVVGKRLTYQGTNPAHA